MEVDVKRQIAAVITCHPENVGGSPPIFIARTDDERDRIAASLAVILQGAVHDLGNGTLVIVKH